MNEIGFSVGRERLLMCSGSECWVIGLGSAPGLSSSQAIRLSSKPRVWRGVGWFWSFFFFGPGPSGNPILSVVFFFFPSPFSPLFFFFSSALLPFSSPPL